MHQEYAAIAHYLHSKYRKILTSCLGDQIKGAKLFKGEQLVQAHVSMCVNTVLKYM